MLLSGELHRVRIHRQRCQRLAGPDVDPVRSGERAPQRRDQYAIFDDPAELAAPHFRRGEFERRGTLLFPDMHRCERRGVDAAPCRQGFEQPPRRRRHGHVTDIHAEAAADRLRLRAVEQQHAATMVGRRQRCRGADEPATNHGYVVLLLAHRGQVIMRSRPALPALRLPSAPRWSGHQALSR